MDDARRTPKQYVGSAVANLFVAGFLLMGGCTRANESADLSPAAEMDPNGLRITLSGPSVIKQGDTWGAIYEAHVENDGQGPIAFAVYPVWLKLEALTPEGQKVKLDDDYDFLDWAPPTDRDLVIIKPGEKRIFNAYFIGRLEPGTYQFRAVLRPSPTEVPEEFVYAMRDEDAVFLKIECRSPTVTVKVL